MKSEWRVTSNTINGIFMYAVYRIKDTNGVDHSGNREMAGGYIESREDAQRKADELNKQHERD